MKSYYSERNKMRISRRQALTAQLLLACGLLLVECGLTEAASGLKAVKHTAGKWLLIKKLLA